MLILKAVKRNIIPHRLKLFISGLLSLYFCQKSVFSKKSKICFDETCKVSVLIFPNIDVAKSKAIKIAKNIRFFRLRYPRIILLYNRAQLCDQLVGFD